ncbi:MAG: peptide-methionine (R)-S-oxide reductase MsrB [Bacteroidetes bacterium]|nr:peptide-methionine (R)-S-oxide reductase MsrB [Fibrella sp.]
MNRVFLLLAVSLLLVVGFTAWKRHAELAPTTARPVDKVVPPGGRRVVKTNAELKKVLTPAQYNVMREEGTEYPNSSALLKVHEKGIFSCAGCRNPLFRTTTKFESGTGWPSFYAPIAKNAINTDSDGSLGMVRTEVTCSVCDAHLGHVFDDGPAPTGLRYCMNGVAMTFKKE